MIVDLIDFSSSPEVDGEIIIQGWRGTDYRPVVTGILSRFPGSRQIWVSRALQVRDDARKQGVSKAYNTYISRHLLPQLGGRALVACVKPKNEAQQTRLPKLGWKKLSNTLWMWKDDSATTQAQVQDTQNKQKECISIPHGPEMLYPQLPFERPPRNQLSQKHMGN